MTAPKVEDEFLTWLKDNPPPEDITVTIEYGEGKEKLFHFKRSFAAYDRYIRELSRMDDDGGPSLTAVASLFLMDTIQKEEREALSAFLNAFPGHITPTSNSLLAIYMGDLTVKVKNVSKPAGQ